MIRGLASTNPLVLKFLEGLDPKHHYTDRKFGVHSGGKVNFEAKLKFKFSIESEV